MSAKKPMGEANGSFIILAAEQRTQIEGLMKALGNARSMLIAFGGDPRTAEDITVADQIQLALLNEIDVALHAAKEHT